nr:hypothetical protein [Propionibacterium sp.]
MSAIAPAAPGRLGEQLDPQRLLTYLTALDTWLVSRRAELDELDAAVQASAHVAELTADVRLGLTLWQAIRTRADLMLTTWDSGRVGPAEREKLSQLIWGRLEGPGTGGPGGVSGLSVPEACRLSDALTAQLRQRLQLDPGGSAVAVRLKDLRATLERLRDQVALEPPDAAAAAGQQLARLATRLQNVGDKAARGGDVGGLLGPLEAEAATFERDLIVGGVLRRQNAERVARIGAARAALAAREPGLRALVAQAVATVTPAPKYAVPDVANLGPVPGTTAELDAFEARLAQVGQAMDLVESSYAGALAEVAQLDADLAAIAAGPSDATLASMVAAARGVLALRPVPVDAARPLVAGCRAYAASLGGRS